MLIIRKHKNYLLILLLPVVLSFRVNDDVLAVVGNHKILVNEFKTRYEEFLLTSGIKDNIVTRRSILQNMINEILLYYYDDNKNIFNNPEYLKELNWAKKQTILAFLKDREIYAKIDATEEELRDAFLKTNQKVAARHLFAFTEEEADSLYKLVINGASFDSLAKQIFTDSILANNGGYLGYFSWGDMDPAFEDAAYSMKVGEISKPVKTKYGYSIIKLEDKVTRPIITEWEFQKKKSHMKQIIRLRKKRNAELDYLKKVVDLNKIFVDEQRLKTLFANLIQNKNLENPVSKEVCVKYENKSYTVNELKNRIDEIPEFHRIKINSLEALEAVVKGIVVQDLLMNLAKEKKYDINPEVITMIEKYNKNIFLKYKRAEIHNSFQFPDSAIFEFYKNNKIYFMTEPQFKIQEIIVSSKKVADSLFNLINKGEDFGKIAKENSLKTAENEGVIEFSNLSQFGVLQDYLEKADLNKVYGPVKIENYYVIFKVLGKKESKLKDFNEVYDLAHRLLKKEKSKFIIQTYIDKLSMNVKINYDENKLSNIKIN
ncbi:peptidylprolyl isomerase [Rosettibacter firmus]|uniref:peptidylprolyl isomerase n=1 Tax=Rosettibacter firmus TaxID=3111522 RepID=UPI00336BC740